MEDANHNIEGFTTKQAAGMVGVSEARIRQLALSGAIESSIILGRRIISAEGVKQAKARNTKIGRIGKQPVGSKVK